MSQTHYLLNLAREWRRCSPTRQPRLWVELVYRIEQALGWNRHVANRRLREVLESLE